MAVLNLHRGQKYGFCPVWSAVMCAARRSILAAVNVQREHLKELSAVVSVLMSPVRSLFKLGSVFVSPVT